MAADNRRDDMAPDEQLRLARALWPELGPWHMEDDGLRYALVYGSRRFDLASNKAVGRMIAYLDRRGLDVSFGRDESGGRSVVLASSAGERSEIVSFHDGRTYAEALQRACLEVIGDE